MISNAIYGLIVVLVLGTFMYVEEYGEEQRKRECQLASNDKKIPKCDFDPNYHGED
jgi:hypothetical protein